MPARATYEYGSWQTVLTTGLDSLANNSLALSAAIDPDISVSVTDALFIEVVPYVSYGSAPTANTGLSIWFIEEVDGSYEDGDASTTPVDAADVTVGLRAVTGAQRKKERAAAPNNTFKLLLKNDGTGQAMAASGNTVKIRFYTIKQS